MKKLLLLLLCVPLIFSCGENLDKEITKAMIDDGYTGKGTYTDSTGVEYVGEFKDGRMHGQGTLTWDNGTIQEGEWLHNGFLGLNKTVIIQDGEKGVLYKFYDGLDKETIYESGKHTIDNEDKMIVYDIRDSTQNFEKMEVLSSNGLHIQIDLSIIHHPIPNSIGYLHLNHGENYVKSVIDPTVKSVTRKVVGEYAAPEVYSTKREEIRKEIYDKTKDILSKEHINVVAIYIRDVILAQTLLDAIERNLKHEQEYKEYIIE